MFDKKSCVAQICPIRNDPLAAREKGLAHVDSITMIQSTPMYHNNKA